VRSIALTRQYLMSYAKTQPELVILAVNTFVKDTEDANPLIRALAIRTMGCLRADKIIDYLPDPLRKCLRDDNPYVRKTAAICVVKLYDLKPSLAMEHGFIDTLREMVSDSNPMVRVLGTRSPEFCGASDECTAPPCPSAFAHRTRSSPTRSRRCRRFTRRPRRTTSSSSTRRRSASCSSRSASAPSGDE